jgi:hypothetical protein
MEAYETEWGGETEGMTYAAGKPALFGYAASVTKT